MSEILRDYHGELCELLDASTETLNIFAVNLYSKHHMIGRATKREVIRTKGYLGADTLLDHLMLKVKAKPQRLDTILEVMMKQETMRDIAERMKAQKGDLNSAKPVIVSSWGVQMVPVSADCTDAVSIAKHLQDQFAEFLVAINTSTRHTDIDNLRIRIYTFFDSEDPCLLTNDKYLTELKKCQSIEDLLLFLMKANLIGYLNYKLIQVFVKAAGNDEAVKSFFDDYKKEFVKFLQCDLPSIVKVFRNIRVTPLPPIGLPDFTLRIGTKWEHSSLYSFKEVFERRFSWAQDLLILHVTQNCIIIKYAVLPFFVSAVVEDLSNPEVIAELEQQDIIVELSPLLQIMAYLSWEENIKTPLPMFANFSVANFLKTHDLAITKQQELQLLNIEKLSPIIPKAQSTIAAAMFLPEIPLPINTSVSDVTNFLQTHDLAITKQQESLLLKITESGAMYQGIAASTGAAMPEQKPAVRLRDRPTLSELHEVLKPLSQMEKRRFLSCLSHISCSSFTSHSSFLMSHSSFLMSHSSFLMSHSSLDWIMDLEEVNSSWIEDEWLHRRITWHDIVGALHRIGHHELAESILFH